MRKWIMLSQNDISFQEDCAPESSVHIDCFGAVPIGEMNAHLAKFSKLLIIV